MSRAPLARRVRRHAQQRVLVAEDDAVVALDLRATLLDLGYEVTDVVGNGVEALHSVESDPPDLALLDIRMPGAVDGIDVGEALMRRNGIPVIYVTAYGDDTTLSRALEGSPYGYVLKPFRKRDLKSAIRIALERRAMERKISASERHVVATLHSIGEAVITTDAEGRVEFVNPAAERLVGLEPSQAAGRGVEEVARFSFGERGGGPPHPVREALDRKAVVRLMEGCFLEGADGHSTPVSDSAAPIMTPGGDVEGCVLVVRDDTDLRAKDEALRLIEQRFREMTEHIEDVFWITAPGKEAMEYLSPAYERIWGRPRDEVYREPMKWMEAIHPDDRERVRAALPKQEEGEHEIEYRIVRPDGEIRWIQDRAFPVKDEAGRLLRVIGIAEDVTERMELTRRQMQQQKMEAVGQLAGGVAHDFNNLLTVIRSQTEMVMQDLASDSDLRPELELVRASAERAKRLTSHLLAFSRQQVLRPEVVDVNDILDELAHILNRLLGEDIDVVLELGSDLPPIKIDVGQLEQALVNLAVNARDAMQDGGTLRLTTDGVEHADPDTDEPQGRFVVLAISDTGAGMNEDVQEQAFEPFFTTKAPGEGTGLGLAMVYGLVRQSGGRIGLDSSPGEGTTFTLAFPAVESALVATTAEERRPEPAPATGRGPLDARVFLVEDDAVVRKVIVRILERAGAEVDGVEDAEAAMEAFRHGLDVDVVVTDMGLPGMKGSALIAEIQERLPGIPVIAISGYPKGALMSDYDLPPDIPVLSKPFTPDELLTLIRTVVTGQGRSLDSSGS